VARSRGCVFALLLVPLQNRNRSPEKSNC